jgi:predicted Zn-dependent protease
MIVRLFRLAAAFLTLIALVACAVAPGTGRTIFTGGMSEEDEKAIGFEQHPKMVQEFGGDYADQDLQAYVSRVGQSLARKSELPNLTFTFTVLDSPIVNAFALPGGYVYVSRGLLALARTEAELASVLGHEIGHVTARHSAERYGQSLAVGIASVGLGVFAGDLASQAGQTLGTIALRSYSRDQELESDTLGIRYMARAGYDTDAAASFLSKMYAHSRLQAQLAGKAEAADDFSILQTHPRTLDRVKLAKKKAAVQPVPEPVVGEDAYLRAIDGLIYGDNPAHGVVRGLKFIHPPLRFSFEVPPGFRLANAPNYVLAEGPEGAFILFDRAPERYRGPMTAYLRDVWAESDLENLERITVNNMEAATGRLRVTSRSGERDLRGLAIRYDENTIYRFLFVTPVNKTARFAEPFRRTTYSFQRLSKREAAAVKPQRIRLHTVRPGESAADIAEHMSVESARLEHLLVLNGLSSGREVKPGDVMKIISDD